MANQLQDRNLRIFISSTFRDMQQEREELIKYVFPEIKKIARERFVEITEVDLRWGVTEEQAENGEALKICLDEINKCKASPIFFIGILGDRYGWIPNQTDQSLLNDDKYKLIADYKDKSVTELEMLYGVLNEDDPNKISYFYFRDKELSDVIETQLESEDKNYKRDANTPDAKLLEEKQTSLKDAIKGKKRVSIDDYKSIKEFSERVKEDLLYELDKLFPKDKVPSEVEKTKIRHAQFAQTRKFYIKDSQADKELDSFMNSTDSYCFIDAQSGMGKSAFIAHSVKRYQELKPNAYIIEHYIGGGDNSTELSSLLFRILTELKETFNIEEELPKADKLEEEFPLWLYKIPKEKETIIFIDALNQINDEKAKKLYWLPAKLPTNLKIIISNIGELYKENSRTIELSSLDRERQEQFITQYLQKSGKAIDNTQKSVLLDTPLTSNPLYLKIVLDELKVFGVYEEVTNKINALLENKSIDDLLEYVLERIEKEYDTNNTIKEILSLIYASRDGMSEEELLEIINNTTIDKLQEQASSLRLTRPALSNMLLALEAHIIEKDGLLNFFHSFMEKAVHDRYELDKEENVNKFREKIADYFEKYQDTKEIKRVARELPYQLYHLKDEERLLQAISNYEIFAYSKEDEWKLEIHSYYLSVKNIPDKEDRFYDGLLEITKRVQDDREKFFIWNKIALYFHHYISLSKAQPLYEQTLVLSKKVLGNENSDTLTCMNNLAELYKSQGEYAKAKPLLKQTLALRKQVLKDTHPDILNSMNSLATFYELQGEYAKAKPLLKQTLALRKQVLGNKDPNTLASINNLAVLYSSQGEYTKAEALFEQVLVLSKEVLGNEHPNTLTSINNLGLLYNSKGEYAKAEKLFKQVLVLSKEVLGDEHPDTLTSINNLGLLYNSKGEYAKAEKLFKQVLVLSKEVLRNGHPNILSCMNNLAALYNSEGEYIKAEELFEQVLVLSKEVLRNGHPNILSCMNNLGALYYSQNKFKKALQISKEAYDINLKNSGKDNPLTQQFKKNYFYVMHQIKEDSRINFNEPFTTLLYLSKSIAFNVKSKNITMDHLYNSLYFVKLNSKAKDIFRQIFGKDMNNLRELSYGISIINEAKELPKMPYDTQMEEYVKDLKSDFGDEPMCTLHKGME